MRRMIVVFALALVPAVSGCRGFDLEPPADFVELEEPEYSGYALRATNARGVVVAVRALDNERGGSLAFWAEAIRGRLRDARGYALLEEKDVTCASGETGRRMRFGRDEGTRPYVYELTLFVCESELFVVEAGGQREDYEDVRAEVDRAVAGFTIQ